jgi:flagellar biosynthetic protein FliQ
MTLVFVPKIIAIFLVLMIALPFMGATLGMYMQRMADLIMLSG